MIYRTALCASEEGYSVSVPGLPGCWSQGATEAEALENIGRRFGNTLWSQPS
jgi:predicted RNase H-like HicB family nuclease